MLSKVIVSTLVLFTALSFSNAQDILAEHEFEADNVTAVTIYGRFCDVYIEPGDQLRFRGSIEGRGDKGDYEITSRLNGDEVEIRVVAERSNWNWNNRITRSRLDLVLPENAVVFVDNSSGDIYARNIQSERIRFETSSGDIEVRNIRSEVRLNSTSGDIEVDEIIGNLDMESTSGDMEVSGVEGEVEAEATSGDVSLGGITGDLSVKTTSGEIELRSIKGAISARSSSGDIEGYRIELTGDSNFRASSGDIDFSFVNDLDELSFDLESSSGDLRVGSKSSEDNLYIKQGGFWIEGVTSSGGQRYTN